MNFLRSRDIEANDVQANSDDDETSHDAIHNSSYDYGGRSKRRVRTWKLLLRSVVVQEFFRVRQWEFGEASVSSRFELEREEKYVRLGLQESMH